MGGNERASGHFASKGFEVQVYNGTAGPRTGSLYHVVDLDEPIVKDETWFTQTIIVKGDTIVVKINEREVVNWTQPPDWDGGREGPGRRITGPGTIALQAHMMPRAPCSTRTSASDRWTDSAFQPAALSLTF